MTIEFSKACKVSTVISQICQIGNRKVLEEILLRKWEKIVLNNRDVDFVFIKYEFVGYLKRLHKEPLIDFMIDTLLTTIF